MDKHQKDTQRRARIKELIDEHCGGVTAVFARRIGLDVSYVSRMMYPIGKPGKKGISVHTIDAIEAAFMLPHGWLDGIEPHDANLALILRLWPNLAQYKRRALAGMARTLSETTDTPEAPPRLIKDAPPLVVTISERRTRPPVMRVAKQRRKHVRFIKVPANDQRGAQGEN